MDVKNLYDVVIAGAGPSGSVLAMLLAKNGYSVLLLDKNGTTRVNIGETLAPAIGTELTAIGLWDGFQKLDSIPSYGTQSSWGHTEIYEQTHLINTFQHGWQVNRVVFDNWLMKQACNAGVDILNNHVIDDLSYGHGQGFSISISNGTTSIKVNSKFLVDATGRRAVLSKPMNAEKIVLDRLAGIASHLENGRSGEQLATLVEAAPRGWWYSNTVPGERLSVIFMTDADLLKERSEALADAFTRLLHQTVHTGKRCSGFKNMSPPSIFSAVSQRVIRPREDNRPWLSVGDASLAVDPLSGSGMLRAFRTAREAANSIDHYFQGDEFAINKYECNRNLECDNYLSDLSNYYNAEHRWPNSLFWQRRHNIHDYFETIAPARLKNNAGVISL